MPNEQEKFQLQKDLDAAKVGQLKLDLIQLNVSPDEFNQLSSDVQTNVAEKLNLLQTVEDEHKQKIEQMQAELVELRANSQPDRTFLNEIKWIFPEIAEANWQKLTTDATDDSSNQPRTISIVFKENVAVAAKNVVLTRVLRLAQSRFADTRFAVAEQTPPEETTQNIKDEQKNANTNIEKP